MTCDLDPWHVLAEWYYNSCLTVWYKSNMLDGVKFAPNWRPVKLTYPIKSSVSRHHCEYYWVHSTMLWSQHPLERLIVGCISCIQQPHVKGGQVISVLEPGIDRRPGSVWPGSVLQSCCLLFSWHLPVASMRAMCPDNETSWPDTRGEWRFFSKAADVDVSDKIMPVNTEYWSALVCCVSALLTIHHSQP